jgi:hypothetical protein
MFELDVRHGLISLEVVSGLGCGFRFLSAACEQYKESECDGECGSAGHGVSPERMIARVSFKFLVSRKGKSNHGLTRMTRIRGREKT